MTTAASPSRVIGRYAIYGEIASGGMATVHFGRLMGSVGFTRTVAIKRLHPHLAKDPEFVKMFLDEARVAARIRHPNVVPTLDVVSTGGELFLVMEYVQGESLARLLRVVKQRGERIPVPIACAIVVGVLHGLHAAHEAKSEKGEKLEIVHRDVSPQNILVGRDGVAHVLDFGVAKATGRLQTTREGQLKGKIGYMPAEQIRGAAVSRVTDIYAASVVLWELLVGERLFSGDNEAVVIERVLFGEVTAPSSRGVGVPKALDDVVMRGLSRDPAQRFATAKEMARAIEAAMPIATASEAGEWVEALAGELLNERQRTVIEIESSSDVHTGSHYRDLVASLTADRTEEEPPRSQKVEKAIGVTEPPRSAPAEEPHVAWVPPWKRLRYHPRYYVIAGVAALAAAVVLVSFAFRLRSEESQEPLPAAIDPSSVPVAIPPPPSASAASASTDVPSSSPPPPTAPAPPPLPPPPAVTAGTVAQPVSHAPPPPRPAPGKTEIVHDYPGSTPAKPSKPSCNPPYTIDAQGVKQYKLECL